MDPPPPSSSLQHSITTIDLNQIPYPSETLASPSPTSLARSIHENPIPAKGSASDIPNELSLSCSECGRPPPLASHERLVCDGCERGFHFRCAGVAAENLPVLDEWVCKSCAGAGVSSRRWTLGRRKESGGDGESSLGNPGNVLRDLRKHSVGEDGLRGFGPGGSLLHSKFVYASNGSGLHKAPGIVAHTASLDFQDVSHRCSSARSLEDITFSSQPGRIRNSSTPFRFPPRDPNEVLQCLRDFVSERHGILEEGWRVEFKQLKNGCGSYAVYRAPDGNIFETMSDVACYLGLASINCVGPEAKSDDASAFRRNGSHVPKRRKLTRVPIGNGITESRGNLISGRHSSFSSNIQSDQSSTFKHGRMIEVTEVVKEENGADDVRQFHEGLPLQYKDFFILSLGKIDSRASYHDASQIWPVGYRSCWHDKITGSLFLCDVLDGGNNGPVFKVKRFSCSTVHIPYGSTVLHRKQCVQLECANKEARDKLSTSDEDCYIETILSDPSLPVESVAFPSLLSSPNEADFQKANHSNPETHTSGGRSQESFADCSPVGENIGEFSLDGGSASEVWSILSQKLADTCYQIYKQMGSLKFFCKHVEHEALSFCEFSSDKSKSSLDKFCSLLGSLQVPSVVKNDEELGSAIEALKISMNADRFGLDVEFVLELIEQSPEIHKCPRYKILRTRDDYLRLPLVGNGFLLINGKTVDQCQQDIVMDSLYREYKSKREPTTNKHSRPPGKHMGMKLPPHLVGDVLQVWEILCRFHDVLNLEPLEFDKLEAELITPWFKSLSDHGPCEQTSSSGSETDQPEENRFIKMETATMKEEAHRQTLSTNSKCACVSLKRAHISLLDVLVSEMQIKVAAVLDPCIDGESKTRRGRRRDVDSSILAIRPKLNLLPINELTWPELARRYILAMLSMDGNVDSAEASAREFGKVFRCLQGDGGVLCGSLIGLAGIEADAQLLAEANKRIYGSSNNENDTLTIEDDDPEPVGASGREAPGDDVIPEWARSLEPVKKLPTNVGTRIRKCVYEALEKDPPDWARKILEHSISKGVYKANASGPTKKAVVSLLADVVGEGLQQKTRKEKKKKTVVSISDIIMRQCRILLRCAASADKEKVFCNLLGRNLSNSSENDEEGMLGSPAMVSRPLDFRTIDSRLTVGVYGGSHEAFIEDVRELWKNIRIAHADQPELVQLAETFSQNSESLYEEVLSLVGKLREYSRLHQMSTEAKKYIGDIVASNSKIPKAPWDKGVCKVCGVDKDDDSVLLCDTCDAEYHTYCLNPPLVRVPEGNWYCPSCVSGVNMLEGMTQGVQFIRQRHQRKYYGDGNYLEELGRLASIMERQDYWEFRVDERILLLKILCDEVLNSIRVRQHLELCSETSADLQQKLRMLHSELKSLKLRDDLLSSKAANKLGVSFSSLEADSNMEERAGATTKHENNSTPESVPKAKGISCSSDVMQPVDSVCQLKDIVENVNEDTTPSESHDLLERSSKLDLISVEMDLTSLQQSIESIECHLSKSSVRVEFLGSDSSGRLYWVSALQGTRPCLFVDGAIALKPKTQGISPASMLSRASYCENTADTHLSPRGSNAPCPFVYGQGCTTSKCPPWILYDSDSEIGELVKYLRDADPKERELKDSILHWQRVRLHDLYQTGKQDQGPSVVEKHDEPNIVTIASTVLEHKYGPFFKADTEVQLQKRGKRSRVTNNGKLYRCKCLERIWPSRHHCLSCHRTFFTAEEFDRHNDGSCIPSPSLFGKKKPSDEPLQQVQNGDTMCPYKFDKISSRFVTNNSIKDLVHGIGLIGSEGTPSLTPICSPYLGDPRLKVLPKKVPEKEVGHIDQIPCKARVNNMPGVCPRRLPAKKHAVNPRCVVPECSLRPLVGRAAQILRQLKINLLDMEAALPEEAFRVWKVRSERRRAWHAFVKAAETIFEMVQATIVLEDMIKTEYIKKEWWYWSSLSAAAKTSTLSSLALRVYSLDNSILYEKSESDLTHTGKVKPVDVEDNQSPPIIDSSEKYKQSQRSNKNRTEAEG